ncbi:hypothetical protein Q3H58_004210 [Pseudomonas psychrotolerans]|nr:hypothetical protein [Pseudomonas psychrotolerans]
MLTLGNLCLLLGAFGIGLSFWHARGIRERALVLAEQECRRRNVTLLDGAVAFSRYRWLADAQGRKRLARLFAFEFTVTGEERLNASLALFGKGARQGRVRTFRGTGGRTARGEFGGGFGPGVSGQAGTWSGGLSGPVAAATAYRDRSAPRIGVTSGLRLQIIPFE